MSVVRVAALVAVVVTVAVTGCGADPGDGDLADDWAALVAPTRNDPVAGCYDAPVRTTVDINTIATPRIPCEHAHTVETFHIGRFPDTATAAPAEGSAEYRAAFDNCERLAADFLGGRWYDTRIDLVVTVPFGHQWDDGGRWYRCDLMETASSTDVINRRTGTLRGAARPDSPVLQRCVTAMGLRGNGYEYLQPTDCAAPHDAEYAGAFPVDGTAFPQDPTGTGLYERCRDLVAAYTGGTRDGVRLGYLASLAGERSWNRGDRYVRCYAWRVDGKLTGTVKGLGNNAPR